MKSGDIIREVSRDLNDQETGYEYTTWPKEQLRSYLYEAITQLAVLFRKLFLVQHVVRVKPGGLWQKACICEQIIRIVGEVTEDGEQLIRYLSNVTDDTRLVWAGGIERCPVGEAHGKYEMTGYSINNVDESMFKVYPPIPRGEEDHFILVECFDSPSGAPDDFNVPTRLVALVKQWMLYRAYAVDSENNPTVIQISNMHRETYMKLLEMELAALQREEEEHGSLRTVPNDSTNRTA